MSWRFIVDRSNLEVRIGNEAQNVQRPAMDCVYFELKECLTSGGGLPLARNKVLNSVGGV